MYAIIQKTITGKLFNIFFIKLLIFMFVKDIYFVNMVKKLIYEDIIYEISQGNKSSENKLPSLLVYFL